MSFSEFKKSASSSRTDDFNQDLSARLRGYRCQETYPKNITQVDRFEREYPFITREYSCSAIDKLIHINDRNISCRIHSPEKPKAVLLHFPAGEFCLGRSAHYDEYLSKLSQHSSIAIISCETRKAPINIYPCAHDDAADMAQWLIINSKKMFNCDQLLIGGESSGANLALHALLSTLKDNVPCKFKGYYAVNGLFECSQDRSTFHKDHHIDLNGNRLEQFLNAYFPIYSSRLSPIASPLLHPLPTESLPPAIFITGTLSILSEETIFFHQKWLISQNSSELKVFPGGIHNFINYSYPLAHDAQHYLSHQINQLITTIEVLKKAI